MDNSQNQVEGSWEKRVTKNFNMNQQEQCMSFESKYHCGRIRESDPLQSLKKADLPSTVEQLLEDDMSLDPKPIGTSGLRVVEKV